MRTRLREWRRRRMLTQRELATLSGVDQGTIVRIEAGESEPRFSTLRKLAVALKIKPEELLEESTQDKKGKAAA